MNYLPSMGNTDYSGAFDALVKSKADLQNSTAKKPYDKYKLSKE